MPGLRFGSSGDDLPSQGQMPYRPGHFREQHPELDRFVVKLSQMLSEEGVIANATPELVRTTADQFLFSFKGWLYGEDLLRQEIRYPSDWWQALKERFFPAWLRSRFPVQETVVIIEVNALYPELHRKLHYPDEAHQIHISRSDYDTGPGAEVNQD